MLVILLTCGIGLLSLKWPDIFLNGSSSQHQFSSIWLGASTKSRSTLGKKGGVKIITYHRILSRGRSTLTSGDVHLYMQLKYSLRCLRLKQENSASFFTPRPTYYCSKTHQKTKKLSQWPNLRNANCGVSVTEHMLCMTWPNSWKKVSTSSWSSKAGLLAVDLLKFAIIAQAEGCLSLPPTPPQPGWMANTAACPNLPSLGCRSK